MKEKSDFEILLLIPSSHYPCSGKFGKAAWRYNLIFSSILESYTLSYR
jgi:hypothetical protein